MQRRVLVIGAHPDDCDVRAGGSAALWTRLGHIVKFVSLTDGSAGHHEMAGPPLAERRRAEAKRAGEVIGIEYEVLDYLDGRLEVSLAARLDVLRLIRRFNPDLVLTHRPCDYHPDHRYTSQLVQDAAYMVTVPPIAPEAPFLRRNPVFGYLADEFTRPYPFSADIVVAIDEVVPVVVEMLHCHASQFYEWLPFNAGVGVERVPTGDAERKESLLHVYLGRFAGRADQYRERLIAQYGEEKGRAATAVETFEISEYGSPLTEELRRDLFGSLG